MATTSEHTTAVVLFDGVCNLCHGFVQFIIARDRQAYFTFASLQSPAGQRLLSAHGLDHQTLDSVVLLEGTRHWTESEAALRIMRRLSGFWPLLGLCTCIPRSLRNGLYRWIARHRYGWFGQRDVCLLPAPELRRRFLD